MIFLTGIGLAFTPEMITDMIGYIHDVFADLSPVVLIIVGVGMGLIFIGAIIHALKG